MLGGPSLRLGIRNWMRWERHWLTGNVGMCPLRTDSASWKSLESFIQLTSFCNPCILPISSRTVSWSSTNLRLAIVSKVELENLFNSSISLRLFSWASRRSRFCSNNCSWRSWWSRRRRSCAWARWSSSCCDSIVSLNFWKLLRSQLAWNSCLLIFAWQSARICSLCRSKRVLICACSVYISWPLSTTGCPDLSDTDDDNWPTGRPSRWEW